MGVLGSGWKWGVVPSVTSPGALKRIEQKVTKVTKGENPGLCPRADISQAVGLKVRLELLRGYDSDAPGAFAGFYTGDFFLRRQVNDGDIVGGSIGHVERFAIGRDSQAPGTSSGFDGA